MPCNREGPEPGWSPEERKHWLQAHNDSRWRAEERQEKRCSNCGLLGQIQRDSQQLVPMLEAARNRDGTRQPDYSTDPLKRYSRVPVCAATERYFHERIETFPWPQYFQELSLDQSKCPSFVQWVPGLSIAEHKEMLDQQRQLEWQKQMAQAQYDFQLNALALEGGGREADRRWREKQADDDRTWRSGERTRDNVWRAGEVIVVVVGVIAAIVISLWSNGNTTNNYGDTLPTPTTLTEP